MELWTGILSWRKCHWTDFEECCLFRRNLFLNFLINLNIVTLTLIFGQSTLVYWLPYSFHTSYHPSQTPCLPWISYATQKLMLDSCKMLQKQSEAFHTFLWHFFPSLKQNFIGYCFSKISHVNFEIRQLWQSDLNGVYYNSYCSCSFKPGIIKIGQSTHNMYSNNIVNFQESSTIVNACTKKSGN